MEGTPRLLYRCRFFIHFPFFFLQLYWTLTISLPVVLYGRGTWSLTLREEHRLRVFENWVLRRIFGSKRDGVTGVWRKLAKHN
jgi:hypothetical protein